MTYRTILVQVDRSHQAEARIRFAAELANRCDAHLVGTALTGISRFVLPESIETGGMLVADQIAAMHAAADHALADFDALAGQAGVRSFEARRANDDWDSGMVMQARYADLLVLGQADPAARAPGTSDDLPDFLLMHSARPLLLLPFAGHHRQADGMVVLAWDGSIEATRAMTCALPLLKKAAQVRVLVFAPAASAEPHGEMAGADIGLYLTRHGVSVVVEVRPGGIDHGEALLSHAADLGADLLVMGGYSHSRLGELVLGGVTRTVMASMTLPVLLAH